MAVTGDLFRYKISGKEVIDAGGRKLLNYYEWSLPKMVTTILNEHEWDLLKFVYSARRKTFDRKYDVVIPELSEIERQV